MEGSIVTGSRDEVMDVFGDRLCANHKHFKGEYFYNPDVTEMFIINKTLTLYHVICFDHVTQHAINRLNRHKLDVLQPVADKGSMPCIFTAFIRIDRKKQL